MVYKDSQKHVVLVRRGVGFPNGMATSDRLRRIGGALAAAGVRVTLLTVGTTEHFGHVSNPQVRGHFEGIDYEYTSGCTVRARRFLTRRLIDLWSHCVATWRVLTLDDSGEKVTVCIGYDLSGPKIIYYLAIFVAKLRGFPVYIEINERPWSLMERKKWFSFFSPLLWTDGAIVISNFLAEWARKDTENRRLGYKVLQVPILASNEDFRNSLPGEIKNYVVFSGSIAYASTMRFIVEAMVRVWRVFPNCKLVLTGYRDSHPEWKALVELINAMGVQQSVTLCGYLDRKDLLKLYVEAKALLIPLFDDVESKARFPTKIGEYLFSARPIVTTKVSDVSDYFQDGHSAYIADFANVESFGEAILRSLNDPRSADVGREGRKIAESNFNISLYGRALADFLV